MSSVDVVIPCYNYARYLPQCVASVLGQEGVEVRALIIDDCSQDESEIVGRRLAEQDSRVEYRRHSINQGHIATYNEGLLEWANSDYVLLLSADDLLSSGALARAASLMDQVPEIGFCYGRCITFKDYLPSVLESEASASQIEIVCGQKFIETLFTKAVNPVPTPTAILRTELQKRVGGYKNEFPHTGDLEMWLRCAVVSSVARFETVQAFKREHINNMSLQYVSTALHDLQQVKKVFESIVCEFADKIDKADVLLNKSKEVLSLKAFWDAHSLFEQGYPDDLCDQLLDFSISLDSSVSSRPEWYRFKWKKRMGQRVWRFVQPLFSFLRR